jgi:hypothetical protein
MNSGTYYVGDLCYVLGTKWNAVCDTVISGKGGLLDGEHKLPDGIVFAMYSTAYGDGCYTDAEDREYAVDSGSIGCVLLTDCDKTRIEIEEAALGHIVEFPRRFNTYCNKGVINIGDISIDTTE